MTAQIGGVGYYRILPEMTVLVRHGSPVAAVTVAAPGCRRLGRIVVTIGSFCVRNC